MLTRACNRLLETRVLGGFRVPEIRALGGFRVPEIPVLGGSGRPRCGPLRGLDGGLDCLGRIHWELCARPRHRGTRACAHENVRRAGQLAPGGVYATTDTRC